MVVGGGGGIYVFNDIFGEVGVEMVSGFVGGYCEGCGWLVGCGW